MPELSSQNSTFIVKRGRSLAEGLDPPLLSTTSSSAKYMLTYIFQVCFIAVCILAIRNKHTEAIPNLSGNASITIDMVAVSEAAPPKAESALNRKLNMTNSFVLEIQAQKLK